MPSNKLVEPEGESSDSLSFLEELPPICIKCYRAVAHEGFTECINCIVEDEPDIDFFVEDHR